MCWWSEGDKYAKQVSSRLRYRYSYINIRPRVWPTDRKFRTLRRFPISHGQCLLWIKTILVRTVVKKMERGLFTRPCHTYIFFIRKSIFCLMTIASLYTIQLWNNCRLNVWNDTDVTKTVQKTSTHHCVILKTSCSFNFNDSIYAQTKQNWCIQHSPI